MHEYLFPPSPVPALPVLGMTRHFPVRRIWCVGRNYAAHAREMGHDDDKPPFFFAKQPDMLVPGGGPIAYPTLTADLHYEGELVVALKGGGENLSPETATRAVFGYAAGIDLTRRDQQKLMKQEGKPWEIAKSFEHSAPVGPITPSDTLMTRGTIRLSVNGEVRQDSDLSHMIWNVANIIAHLSAQVTLETGDIIFTGTPEGVGAVVPGDHVAVEIEGLAPLGITISPR